jgi:hypothetical protein
MTRDEAVRIAETVAQQKDWLWSEPIHARQYRAWFVFGSIYWDILSNANKRGCNVRITIEDATGKVVRKKFLPR